MKNFLNQSSDSVIHQSTDKILQLILILILNKRNTRSYFYDILNFNEILAFSAQKFFAMRDWNSYI